MSSITSQITSVKIVFATVYSGTEQRKHQKLHVTGLCAGNSPGTGEFPPQMASNLENVSIWWRHHESSCPDNSTHLSNVSLCVWVSNAWYTYIYIFILNVYWFIHNSTQHFNRHETHTSPKCFRILLGSFCYKSKILWLLQLICILRRKNVSMLIPHRPQLSVIRSG